MATRQYPPPGKEVTSLVPLRGSADCNAAASKQNAFHCGDRQGKAPCRIARQTSMMLRCNASFLISPRREGLLASLQSAYRNPNIGYDKVRHKPLLFSGKWCRSLS